MATVQHRGFLPRFFGKSESHQQYRSFRENGIKLERTMPMPTSASRRGRPQNNLTFKLENMANGDQITVARHAEPDCLQREGRDVGPLMGVDTQLMPAIRLPRSMQLTSDAITPRNTGWSESRVVFSGAAPEPWMRGNTTRFGNRGAWVANRHAARGGVPGLPEENFHNFVSFAALSSSAYGSKSRTLHTSGNAVGLPSIRGRGGRP